MSIESFIKRVCVQTAVYWGNPVNDGYGNQTYDAPREIKCRWTDQPRNVFDNPRERIGEILIARSEILVVEDLSIGGWLYQGNLVDLEDSTNNYEVPANPKDIEDAYQIVSFDKIPLFRSKTKFVRTIYLGFRNM